MPARALQAWSMGLQGLARWLWRLRHRAPAEPRPAAVSRPPPGLFLWRWLHSTRWPRCRVARLLNNRAAVPQQGPPLKRGAGALRGRWRWAPRALFARVPWSLRLAGARRVGCLAMSAGPARGGRRLARAYRPRRPWQSRPPCPGLRPRPPCRRVLHPGRRARVPGLGPRRPMLLQPLR